MRACGVDTMIFKEGFMLKGVHYETDNNRYYVLDTSYSLREQGLVRRRVSKAVYEIERAKAKEIDDKMVEHLKKCINRS